MVHAATPTLMLQFPLLNGFAVEGKLWSSRNVFSEAKPGLCKAISRAQLTFAAGAVEARIRPPL